MVTPTQPRPWRSEVVATTEQQSKRQNPRQQCRWKRMPPRDEHGELRVTYEFRPARTALDRERFDDLARRLYQRWVLEPAPWEGSASAVPVPAPIQIPATDPTDPIITQEVL